VFSFSHQLQVLDGVVAGVAINMVNDLMLGEKPLTLPLHDQPVFHDIALRVSERMVWREDCPIHAILTVGDARLETGMGLASNVNALPLPLARLRTELPLAVPAARNVCPAGGAGPRRRLSPSTYLVAAARTVAGCFVAPVFGVKILTAVLTRQCNRLLFHTTIIPHEEKYCEIAVKRLAQEVLL